MSEETLEEPALAPVDYLVLKFTDLQPTGEGLAALVDLVDQGIVRLLDFEVITRAQDGTVVGLRAEDVSSQGIGELDIFVGASTGMFGQSDVEVVGEALEPGDTAIAILFENTWAKPFISAVRSKGGQVIATGRVTVDELAAALDLEGV
jgi:uncharacterized membrane protein